MKNIGYGIYTCRMAKSDLGSLLTPDWPHRDARLDRGS